MKKTLIFILTLCIASSVVVAPLTGYAKVGNTCDIKQIGLNVNYAVDIIKNYKNSYIEYDEYNDKNCPRIIFTTNTVLKDFRFIEIGYKEEVNDVELYEKAVLYSLKELSPEKPFVTAWVEQGLLPHRGISFVDKNNTLWKFSIRMSGENDLLYLTEISHVAQVGKT